MECSRRAFARDDARCARVNAVMEALEGAFGAMRCDAMRWDDARARSRRAEA